MTYKYSAACKILALSSSRVGDSGYLEAARPHIEDLVGLKKLQVAFIPFALVNADYAGYTQNVRDGLKNMPYVINTVLPQNAKNLIEQADAIMVGGGNTFKLLYELYNTDILTLIQAKLQGGTPYISWSAGSNILSPGIYTTNDMPVIQPPGFKALNVLPFQINPHYNNDLPPGHRGETRDQRLEEFLMLNQESSIVGLREGTGLLIENAQVKLVGDQAAFYFTSTNNKMVKKEMNADELFLKLNSHNNING